MGDIDITLWLNSHKYEALTRALGKAGKDVETEAQARLDDLYMQTVPLLEQREIEEQIAQEEKRAEENRLRQQRIGVLQVTENGQTAYYQSDKLTNQFRIARSCAVALRDKEAIRNKDLTSAAFRTRQPISREAFEYYCSHPTKGPVVTAMAAVDFDKGTYSQSYIDGWTTYPIKGVIKAANNTDRMTGITEERRNSAFLERLCAIEPLETEQDISQDVRL